MKNFERLVLYIGFFSWMLLPDSTFSQCGNGTFTVLHYTETSGYNHNTRSQSLAMFQAIGNNQNFTVVNDTDGDEFNSLANLQRFAVVIFSNTSGNSILSAAQRANFEAYIQSGGSYIGIHAASDTYRHSSANGNRTGTWDWYAENVAGCSVQESPNHTSANHNNNMNHRVPGHPTLTGIPSPWNKTEEYYYWQNGYLNSSFTEVLRVNRTGGASYDVERMTTHVKELQWGGRAFYTSLGHAQSNFTSDQNFRKLLENAVLWTADPNIGNGGGGSLNLTANITNASCDIANGAIDLSVTGGSGNYTYTWSNNATSQDLNAIGPGSYTVQVDDGNGCSENETFTVTNAGSKPVLGLNISQAISCFGASDGGINSLVSGANGNFTYQWNTGQNSSNLSNIGAGFYELVVTSGAGCKDTAALTLTDPSELQLDIQIQVSPSCVNPTAGQLLGQVSGGTGTLTYSWNTGATSAQISGLDSGTYQLTVQDQNGCSISKQVSLGYSSFSLSLDATQSISCFGGTDGEITTNINGGKSPFTYSWDSGQNTRVIQDLGAGLYILTVTDGDGCVEKDSLQLNEPNALSVQISMVNPISCYGSTDAALLATPQGGDAPYTYFWNNTAGTDQLGNLGAGTYTVDITDTKGCTATETLTLSNPDSLQLILQIQQEVSCNGLTDGEIISQVSGGTGAYSYVWSTGQNTPNLLGIGAGNYTLSVRDGNSCLRQQNISLQEPDAIIPNLNISQQISCFGGNDGEITSNVSGGSSPYTYVWSSGSTSPIAQNLIAANHTVQITDSKGCTAQETLQVMEPSALQISTQMTASASCNGASNGAGEVLVSGGTAPYTYLWSGGQTTAAISGLNAGTYTVQVTDANGCQGSEVLTINNNIAWSLNISQNASITCFGGATASVIGQIQNGNGAGPFTYLWSNGDSDSLAENLGAGIYSLTATDNAGCQSSKTLTISQPDSLELSLNIQNQLSCNGANDASIASVVQGGTAPYTYAWSNGQTSTNASNVGAGVLTLTLTDANGCTATETITLSNPDTIQISLQIQQEISCNGSTDGEIIAQVSGGTGMYSYVWNTGQNTPNISGVGAGSYTLSVRDSNNCLSQQNISLQEPDAIIPNLSISQEISCFGGNDGAITSNVSGGSSPYTYVWSSGSTSQTAQNLVAANHTLQVSDSKGCMVQGNLSLTEPPALQINTQMTASASCNGASNGAGEVLVSGGTAPYTYLWSGGQTTASISGLDARTYTVQVTDANGCQGSEALSINNNISWSLDLMQNTSIDCFGGATASAMGQIQNGNGAGPFTYLWSNGDTDSLAENLRAGNYSLTVTDNVGCQASKTLTITQPDSLELSLNILTPLSCGGVNDASITSVVQGGTAPYTYAWSNGQTSANASNVGSGVVTLTLTDANGCSQTSSLTIQAPNNLAVSLGVINEIQCHGDQTGSIQASPAGANGTVSYLWSNGQTTALASNLPAGWHSVEIQDGLGCVVTDSLLLAQPPALLGSISEIQSIDCKGGNEGALEILVSGGRPAYSYVWSNNSQTAGINDLVAGQYSVTVRDVNQCEDTFSYTLAEPDAMSTSLTLTQAIQCAGNAQASVNVDVSGGTAPYTYLWNDGNTSSDRIGLVAGLYTVQIEDARNCLKIDSLRIGEPEPLNIQLNRISDISCAGLRDGAAEVQVQGGSAPYHFLWSNGQNDSMASNLSAAWHVVEVRDGNDCVLSDSILISEPEGLENEFEIKTPITCHEGSDGSLVAHIQGGQAPYSYLWSNNQTDSIATNLGSSMHMLTVQDANDCILTDSIFLTEPESLQVKTRLIQDASCSNAENGAAWVEVQGGTSPYQYSWNNGIENDSLLRVVPGTYEIEIRDANGCLAFDSLEIGSTISWAASVNVLQEVSCFGGDDAIAWVELDVEPAGFTYDWSSGEVLDTAINLSGGMQFVEVSDRFGCEQLVQFEIAQPDSIEIFAQIILPSPNEANGAILIDSVANALGPYDFLWSTGENRDRIKNLEQGIYNLLLIDEKGCEATAEFELGTTAFAWESFEAIPDFLRNRVQLRWASQRERGNQSFTIERSIDNLLFETLLVTDSWGDSAGLQPYEAYDENPFETKNYYRIKQTFFNGQYSYYSQTREVVFGETVPGYLATYPVPLEAGAVLNLEFELEAGIETNILIVNALQQRVYHKQFESQTGRQKVEIPTDNFSPGLYYIKVENAVERYNSELMIYR